jgi:hypothetical protein
MPRSLRLLVLILCLAMFITNFMAVSRASAETESTANGSHIISATLEPARDVLVNSQGQIIQIDSNSAQNVTPVIYMGSFKAEPVKMTSYISRQYQTIIASCNTNHAGIIYSLRAKIVPNFDQFIDIISLDLSYRRL